MVKKKARFSFRRFLQRKWLWLGSGFALLGLVGFWLISDNSRSGQIGVRPSPSPSASQMSPSSTPSATPRSTPKSPTSTAPRPTATPTVAAPILQKSSGNNGPVPAGAIVEFVCRTLTQVDCSVKLTNQKTSQIITLTKKTTQGDGRGAFGATWNWEAVSGDWHIVAEASKDGGSAVSATQTITVQ